ncbi:MAG: C4-dicarboxylate ABC transporter [Gammaproteobacteria bacterium]|nr:C4-dicarboxylate ABC transporter [Gammaproteobacteria bacterium]MBK80891.1 C4-dicarboxylate ABC transporter [Gammaproteobacteria bacterium]|tara:strand:+ start:1530 stop:2552 length:1023 start_codon:yes stop_codon:yes gene_type:complete
MTISDLARRFRLPAGLAVVVLLAGGAAQAATLKIATLSPEGSAWMELLRAGGEEVAERTGGRVQFKFYPGGVMGDDKAVLRKIRLGQLHGAVLTSSGLVQTYNDIQLYGLPLLFESYAEVDAVRAELDPVLIDGLRAEGFTSFGFAEVGFARAMSRVPVTSVAEVQTQKVWTPDGDPGSARALESFGVTPIPLSIADVLGGLQTGLINGVAVPPVAAIALQWHTQLDYVMDLPLLYVYGMLAVANRPFERLSEADQAVVGEVMAGVVDQVNARARADDANALQALYGQGLERTAPDAGELDEWRAYAARANREMVEDGLVSGELLERLQALVEAHRAAVD